MKRNICLLRHFLGISLLFFLGLAPVITIAQPELELEIEPNRKSFVLGQTAEITLMARSSRPDDRFSWSFEGPGELQGDKNDPAIFYLLPTKIEEKRAEVIITVTATNSEGGSTSKTVTFTLTAPEPTPTPTSAPTATPTPTPSPSPTPLPTPTPTPLPPSTPTPGPVSIGQVFLKDPADFYYVPAGKIVHFVIELNNVDERFRLECDAIRGKAHVENSTVIYTPPEKAKMKDLMTVKVVERESRQVVVQKVIKIQTFSVAP